jgi:hypothetical protein
MTPSSRDRISVDLHGLKAALFARALATDSSPSELVRKAVAQALGEPVSTANEPHTPCFPGRNGERVRLGLRMQRDDAAALLAAARRAGLGPGDFVASLVSGVPVVLEGGGRVDHIAAITASSAELSTLSRDIHHLSNLLRNGEVVPALAYRDMLKTLDADIRRHLLLAAGVLAGLRPRSHSTQPSPTLKR